MSKPQDDMDRETTQVLYFSSFTPTNKQLFDTLLFFSAPPSPQNNNNNTIMSSSVSSSSVVDKDIINLIHAVADVDVDTSLVTLVQEAVANNKKNARTAEQRMLAELQEEALSDFKHPLHRLDRATKHCKTSSRSGPLIVHERNPDNAHELQYDNLCEHCEGDLTDGTSTRCPTCHEMRVCGECCHTMCQKCNERVDMCKSCDKFIDKETNELDFCPGCDGPLCPSCMSRGCANCDWEAESDEEEEEEEEEEKKEEEKEEEDEEMDEE